ncbi:DUF2977 domain-containing protein [Staphylococcus sp. 231237_7MaSpsaltlick]|uniref:DUF2977 domain-containing protein n=1 Tax=Staphylococcus sp. 231237_7MaSpsaltlick TaxID=3367518 RepID=UPI00370A704A
MEFENEDANRNDELKIYVNDKDEIIGYAIVGGISGQISVPYEKAPANFVEVFAPKYFLYKNGEISENPDYEEPINEM